MHPAIHPPLIAFILTNVFDYIFCHQQELSMMITYSSECGFTCHVLESRRLIEARLLCVWLAIHDPRDSLL